MYKPEFGPSYLLNYILNRVDIDPCTDCWIWKLSKFKDGYGRANYKNESIRAHRLSAHVFLGFSLDREQWVLHNCHNPPCVNPKHLYIGSHQQNMDDMYAASRGPTGERAGLAKLTWDEVAEIRRRYKPNTKGPNNQKGLAKEFGVVQTIISRIILRQIWK